MKLKPTRKITKILLVIFLGNILACSNNKNLKEKPNSITTENIMFRNIEFKSQGATLRGRLYLPENKSKKTPVVIMAHGFTTTINGMTADKYAERFREEGFAVLLYDHRNFGISDGEPQILENDELKQFDVVMANPPYSVKRWSQAKFMNDPFGRNIWGTPPQGCADYGFQQHSIKSLKPDTGCSVSL